MSLIDLVFRLKDAPQTMIGALQFLPQVMQLCAHAVGQRNQIPLSRWQRHGFPAYPTIAQTGGIAFVLSSAVGTERLASNTTRFWRWAWSSVELLNVVFAPSSESVANAPSAFVYSV